MVTVVYKRAHFELVQPISPPYLGRTMKILSLLQLSHNIHGSVVFLIKSVAVYCNSMHNMLIQVFVVVVVVVGIYYMSLHIFNFVNPFFDIVIYDIYHIAS